MSVWQWLFRSEDRKSDLDAEIEAHLALAAADRRERGMGRDRAHAEAQREFGNVALVKDVTREAWGWVWLERLLQDAKYALRQIRRSPGFAAAVIGTLALGIAATAAMFTVVDGVLLSHLPYKHADRLVQIGEGQTVEGGDYLYVPYLDIEAWREQLHSFEAIAFDGGGFDGRNFLQGNGTAVQIGFTRISANLFSTLGVSPQLGPGLPNKPEGFAKTSDAQEVVLSDSAWRTVFGGDRNIVGKTVHINDEPYTVVGVMPRGFFFPDRSDDPQVWGPIVMGDKDQGHTGDSPGYGVIGRLKPGVTRASALAELKTVQAHVAMGYVDPEWRKHALQVNLRKYSGEQVRTDQRHALLALTAASSLLWLIACVNATNLLLARGSARQREIAMRGALGASRRRLMQQLTIEGLVLSISATVLGIGLAVGAISIFHRALKQVLPSPVPSWPSVTVLVALSGLTILSAVLSSAWPSWMAARLPIEPVLRQGGQQSGVSRAQHRLRGGLVIAEIAMSLALLASCGLLLRTIYALHHVPLGFRTDHIIVANLEIPTYRFAKTNATATIYQPLLERVQHLPGVDAAGLMTDVPLGHTFSMRLMLSQKSTKADQKSNAVVAEFKAASPSLQRVFGFPMFKGRYFNAQDTSSADPVVVVNRAFAHAFMPDEQDAGKIIGKDILQLSKDGPQKNKQARVIGVLGDFQQSAVGTPSRPEIQVSLPQITSDSGFYTVLEGIAMDLAVRTQRPPSEVIPELRAALKQASPELAGSNFTTMDQIVEDSYGSQMLAARLLEIFAGSALLLCVAGLYGLLAYVVSQRTREMGVRFALGAARGDVMGLVMRQAGVLVVAGVSLGLVLAFLSGKLVRNFLYGVSPHDGWTLATVAIVLMLAGALAAYLPALRAARVDPVEALRTE
ncbi:putative permease [Silvibacterium bohemicum]|uniref:Putative permease n=1 Tax=Silvibacterium bohemicum TaxID=1577686 RepID=A0A841JP34_9BACT|nr:ABC transporter permease [Silvibacterium bohemicum]MBB6142185.1 putative permease [Silvibacterium bohemicum]